jgi:hypothetical protein
MHGTALACRVCGTAIAWPHAGMSAGTAVCHAVPCRMVMQRRDSMGRQAFDALLERQARHARLQKARVRAEARLLEQKLQAEAAEHEARWAGLLALLPDHPPERFPRLVLPSGRRRQANLAQRRIGRYRDHLNRLIGEALQPPARLQADEPAKPEAAAMPALASQLCAVCAGGCCTGGGDTAYLTAATLRRFMAGHPRLRPRDVLAAYLGRLRARTQEGSCINHTADGCSLPLDMRSDTCNRFVCAPQADMLERLAQPGAPEGAVVIVRRQDQWRKDTLGRPNEVIGMALVTAQAITPLTQPAGAA